MPDRLLRSAFVGALVVSALCICLHLHGYSLAIWHQYLDGSEAHEVLLGEPQGNRSDDFDAELPLMMAEGRITPAFPAVTPLVGFGENAVANAAKLPVLAPVALFRPTTWGYFVSGDVGLSFSWVFLVSGLFLSTLWALRLLTDGPALPLILIAAFHAASPTFHFWSFHYFEVEIAAALLFCACVSWVGSKSRLQLFAWAALIGWSLGALALNLYPPFQVPFGYLSLLMALAWSWMHRPALRSLWTRFGPAWLGLAVALAVAIVAVGGLSFYFGADHTLEITAATVYPGRRFSTGGDVSFMRLFLHDYFVGWRLHHFDWGTFGNICEAASGAYVFPVVAPWALLASSRPGSRLQSPAWLMTAFVLGLLIFMTCGVPAVVAKVTLLSFVPANRAVVALDLADAALLAIFVTEICREPLARRQRRLCAGLLAGWTVVMAAMGLHLHHVTSSYAYPQLALACLIVCGSLFLLLERRWAATGVALLLAAQLAASQGFNPLVRGGSDVFETAALGQTLRRLDQDHGGRTHWLVYSPSFILADYPRALGLAGFAGTYSYPQAALWSILDPAGKSVDVWNRFAHVTFLPGVGSQATMVSPVPNQVVVTLDPASPVLQQLGVDYVLVDGVDLAPFERAPRLAAVARLDRGRAVFAVRR